MFGKLLPYTLVFLFVLGLADLVLFLWFKMPLRGDRMLLLMAGTLFILANQLFGALLAVVDERSGCAAVCKGHTAGSAGGADCRRRSRRALLLLPQECMLLRWPLLLPLRRR